jgi:hypothetical protein
MAQGGRTGYLAEMGPILPDRVFQLAPALPLYQRYEDRRKLAALRRFVIWGLSLGQSYGIELGYIPLPAEVAALSRAAPERVE